MRRYSRKKMLKPALFVLALVIVFVLALLAVHFWEASYSTQQAEQIISENDIDLDEDESGAQIYYGGVWYTLRDDLETMLVMGVDDFEEDISEEVYRNTQQADFLMLLILDEESESFSALHLNRDTMTEIQILGVTGDLAGTFTGQLALAHTYGTGGEDSCENTVTAVENLLYGVEIDHYLSMTMDAVAIVNDLVGGVTLTIMDDFTSVDPEMVEGETITLSGTQALTYVRNRTALEDSSNLSRMERQQQYLTALLEQAKIAMANDSGFSASAILEISEYIYSDCNLNRLSAIADTVGEYDYEAVYSIDGEAIVGEEYMEYYVDEDALQELIIELFYEAVE